jgi:hypothetical protein
MSNLSISQDTFLNAYYANQSDINGSATASCCFNFYGSLTYALFKVADVSSYIGKTITSATLHIYVSAITGTYRWTNGVHIDSIDTTWDESTASYTNNPAWGNVQTTHPAPISKGWYAFDIKEILKRWIEDNNGLCMYGESGYSPSGLSGFFFDSTEGTNIPYIEVSYIDTTIAEMQEHTCNIELLQYSSTVTAEAGTTDTTINSTAHGLVEHDFIVNTTRRSTSQLDYERGCRRVQSSTANTITVDSLTNQIAGDSIRLYKWSDISSYVQLNSINLALVAESEDSFSFTMISPTQSQPDAEDVTYALYCSESTLCSESTIINDDSVFENGIELLPQEGQYIRIKFDDTTWFTGIIDKNPYEMADPDSTVSIQISVIPLKHRASSRPIIINYAIGATSEDIVNDMLDYLVNEGIEAGTISTGITLSEAWSNDSITIAEVLDEIANKNQYQWFIDKDFKLNFYDSANLDSIRELTGSMNATYCSESTYCSNNTLCSDQSFSDFRDVKVSNNLQDYKNSLFFIGGNDSYGNVVKAVRGLSTDQNAKQDICAGSGIYGEIIRNSSITDVTTLTASTSTTTTNLNISSHPFAVGDYFFNRTRNVFGYVIAIIDANNVTCTIVASQANGDSIDYYTTANLITKNAYRQKCNKPTTLTFQSFDMTFLPQQKLHVNLPIMGIPSSYWNIEQVAITDVGRGYFSQTITAVLKDVTDFSSQRRKNFTIDFFKNF